MQIRELDVPGVFEVTPALHSDDRGLFLEWYRFDRLAEAVGHPIDVRQANISVSRRGVLRGLHFADVPRGQAKYVSALSGAVLDFVVDIRVGSPTFGVVDSILLDDVDRRAVYMSEGLGHAFVALTGTATVSYLVSDTYNPEHEHTVNPLDPELRLPLPGDLGDLILSPKDAEAPSLAQAVADGILPTWDECRRHYSLLDGRS